MKTLMLAMAVTSGLLIARLPAQHEEHHPGDAPAPADQVDNKKPGSMMPGGMMSQMPMMMMGQSETSRLVDQLSKSFAAIQAETDSAALQVKLTEHAALLQELQTKVQAQSHRMEMMRHMMDTAR